MGSNSRVRDKVSEQPRDKQPRFISLRVKLLIGFTVLFTVVFAGAYYWFYHFATDMAMRRIGEDLRDTLAGVAAGVNGDELQALYEEGVARDDGFTDDPRYWRQIDWFDTVHSVEPRAWPYTYVPGDRSRKQVIFITDLYVRYDASKATQFREQAELDDPQANYDGMITTTLYLTPYTDDWGSWVSGYTPVKNSQGEVVAGLGIDFRADYVFQVQKSIRDAVLFAFAITYTTLFVLVFLVSRTLTQPVIALTHVARCIGEGDYQQDLSSLIQDRFPDEIEVLAQVFSIMVDKVRQREEKLKKEVAELRIEIDEVKRQKQVSEIVDTDFFQDLQAKARAMRERRSASGRMGE